MSSASGRILFLLKIPLSVYTRTVYMYAHISVYVCVCILPPFRLINTG